MALVREFTHVEPHRVEQHEEVHKCTYTSFDGPEGPIFQLSTYGRANRGNPDKISQSLQFDREGAKVLIALLMEAFPELRRV